MGMDQYLLIPFLGEWTSINPSYFDVNYRGTSFWHTAIWFLHHPCFQMAPFGVFMDVYGKIMSWNMVKPRFLPLRLKCLQRPPNALKWAWCTGLPWFTTKFHRGIGAKLWKGWENHSKYSTYRVFTSIPAMAMMTPEGVRDQKKNRTMGTKHTISVPEKDLRYSKIICTDSLTHGENLRQNQSYPLLARTWLGFWTHKTSADKNVAMANAPSTWILCLLGGKPTQHIQVNGDRHPIWSDHHWFPSGKRLHSYRKSPFWVGKSTINGPCSIAM